VNIYRHSGVVQGNLIFLHPQNEDTKLSETSMPYQSTRCDTTGGSKFCRYLNEKPQIVFENEGDCKVFEAEDEGAIHLRNVGNFLQVETAQHFRLLEFSI
jgi:hypothetical protein